MNRITLLFLTALMFSVSSANALQIKVQSTSNYSPAQLLKLQKVLPYLERVLNSQEFKNKILAKSFVQTNGMNNQQIYDFLMSGAEQAPDVTPANETMDLFLALYKPKWYQSKKVIGYTDPTVHTIFTNLTFYNNAYLSDIADNITHEWCHKMGFDHDFKATARRPNSVPYAVGYIVDDMVAEMAGTSN